MNYVSFFGSSGRERHSRQKGRKRNAAAGRWGTALTARQRKQRGSQAGVPAIPSPKTDRQQCKDPTAGGPPRLRSSTQLDTAVREPATRLLPSLREETECRAPRAQPAGEQQESPQLGTGWVVPSLS